MKRSTCIVSLCLLVAGAHAQDAEPILPDIGFRAIDIATDSGLVSNDTDQGEIVYSTEVRIPKTSWIRLEFGDVLLSGQADTANESLLVITSLQDGATQYMNSRHIAEWQNTSAYFNGDAVRVEIFAAPGTGENRVEILAAAAGELDQLDTRSICGAVDDRVLSNDARDARYLPAFCSAWLIDNRCFLSAGHCVASGGVVQFNVPLSTGGGSPVNPPPQDQYSVDAASMQSSGGGTSLGNDWAYFGVFNNSNTGLSPFEAQGDTYALAPSAPPVSGQTIRITGYGSTSSPVPNSWNLVQKTHAGPYVLRSGTVLRYAADTTGGNSGSAVLDESTGLAIGIHTNAGCNSVGGNQGCSISNSGLQNALANPQGVCQFSDCNNNGQNDFDELAAGAPDCNNNNILDECEIASGSSDDCNNNSVPDECEMVDCNNNGILDSCDITSGFDPDCNSNGQPDSCDLAPIAFTDASPVMNPIGFADPQTHVVVGAPTTVTDVTLDFSAAGDLATTNERITINVGATFVGFAFENASSCPQNDDTDQIVVNAADWNNAIDGSGDVTISMQPSFGVSSTICFDSHISVTASYGTEPSSADNNSNNIPDECETVACSPADITTTGAGAGDPGFGVPDGFVTSADLNFFVNAWVASDLAVADVTTTGAGAGDPGFGVPDGSVTAADLNFYINLWVQGCP